MSSSLLLVGSPKQEHIETVRPPLRTNPVGMQDSEKYYKVEIRAPVGKEPC